MTATIPVQTLQRWHTAADRIGVARDEYARQRLAGKRWCGYHRTFEDASEFSGKACLCREGFRICYRGGQKSTQRPYHAARWVVYIADARDRADRLCGIAGSEIEARERVRRLNEEAMRGWRRGESMPPLYYAIAEKGCRL